MKNLIKTIRFYLTFLLIFDLSVGPAILAASDGISVDKGAAAANQATLDTARNGVPVVNIVNPNANGLSHNKFTNYNVDKKGLVLNNSKVSGQSKLAGQIYANTNLKNNAKTILNEVTSTNKSVLKGYTEVFGNRANVIVANPNGITCNGCGFINTPKVTLTTGRPTFNGSGFSGFDVDKGKVLIEGLGLNTDADYFDVITRVAEINAQIYADKELNIITGRNIYDYNTGKITPKAEAKDKPQLSIDGSLLGSIYAGVINFVSTEKGVGVNLGGDVTSMGRLSISSEGDVKYKRIESAGKINIKAVEKIVQDSEAKAAGSIDLTAGDTIELKGVLASNSNINIYGKKEIKSPCTITTSSEGSIKLNSDGTIEYETIESSKDINITSKDGAIVQSKKSLANGTLNITGKSLSLSGSIQSVEDMNFSGKDITLIGELQSLRNMNITGESLNSKEAEIYTGVFGDESYKGDLNIILSKNAEYKKIVVGGSIKIEAGDITQVESLLSADTFEVIGKDITLNGTTQSEKDIILNGNNINLNDEVQSLNNLNIISSGVVTNSGNLYAGVFNNSLYQGNLFITADNDISLNGKIQANGTFYIKSSSNIHQGSESSLESLNNLTISGENLNCSGIIKSISNVSLNSSGLIDIMGSVYAGLYENDTYKGNITLKGNEIEYQKLIANGDISITGKSITQKESGAAYAKNEINFTGNTTVNRDGYVLGLKGINITSDYFTNYGNLWAGVFNGEKLDDSASINVNSKKIENSGEVIAGRNINITSGGYNTINNYGYLGAYNDINLKFSSLGINSNSEFHSNNTLKFDTNNNFTFNNYGKFYADSLLKLSSTGSIANNHTDLNMNGAIELNGSSFTNNGTITSNKLVKVNVPESIENYGIITSVGSIDFFTGATFANYANGKIIGGLGETKIVADSNFYNQGSLTGAGDLNLRAGNDFYNYVNGQIVSGGNLKTVSSGRLMNLSGNLIFSNGDMILEAGNHIENNQSNILSLGSITLQGLNGAKNNSIKNYVGTIEADADILINTNYLSNSGRDIDNGYTIGYRTYPYQYYVKSVVEEYYISSSDLSTVPSYINSNGNLTINADKTYNYGSQIYGYNVNINGSTLENTTASRSVYLANHKRYGGYYYYYYLYIPYGEYRSHTGPWQSGYVSYSSKNPGTIQAGNYLGINVSSNVSNGITQGSNAKTLSTKSASTSYNTATIDNIKKTGKVDTSELATSYFDGILKKGENGLFKVNTDSSKKVSVTKQGTPKLNYIIETNVEYIDLSKFYGSDYFMEKTGFNPEEDTKILGDSYFETKLVNKAIFESTGKKFLNDDIKSDIAQMKYLIDNGLKAQKDLQLSVGVTLSKEIINQLNEPIVWFVEKEINGMLAIVPEVYMPESYTDRLSFAQSTITADDVNITADTVENAGKISSNESLSIDAKTITNETGQGAVQAEIVGKNVSLMSKEEIINLGSKIFGEESLFLKAGGDIVNETTVSSTTVGASIFSSLDSKASIGSGGFLSVDTGKNFLNKAAEVSAVGDANITADTVENSGKIFSGESLVIDAKNITNETSQGASQSEIVGKNVSLIAKEDIVNMGSKISSENSLFLKAGGDIINETTVSRTTSGANIFSKIDSKASIGSGGFLSVDAGKNFLNKAAEVSSQGSASITAGEDINFETIALRNKNVTSNKTVDETKNYGSSLQVGGSLKMDSKQDINVIGSSVDVAGSAAIFAKGDLNVLAAQDSYYSRTVTTKKHTFSKKTTVTEKYKVTNVASSINVGGTLMSQSGGDTHIAGSNFKGEEGLFAEAGKYKEEVQNREGSINIYALKDIDQTRSKTKKSRFKISFSGSGLSLFEKKDTSSLIKKETLKKSLVESQKTLGLKSGKDINVIASDVTAAEDAIFDAGRDFNVTNDFDNYYERTKSKTMTASISLKTGNSGVGGSADIDMNEKDTTKSSNSAEGSNITVGRNMQVEAGRDFNTIASDFTIGNNADIHAKRNINIITASETQGFKEKEKNLKVSVSAGISANVAEAIDSVKTLGDLAKDGGALDAVGSLGNTITSLASGNGVDEALSGNGEGLNNINKGVGAVSTLAGGVSATGSLSLDIAYNERESESSNSIARGSTFNVGGDLNMKTDTGDIKFIGADVNILGNANFDSGRDFIAEAGKSTSASNSSDKSLGVSTSSGVSGSKSGYASYSTTYTNTSINVNNQMSVKTKRDATIQGGNLKAEDVNLDVGRDLNVASIQDTSSSRSSSLGVSQNGGNVSKSTSKKAWVETQTSIVGTSSINIDVKNKTTNTGAVIANIKDDGNAGGNLTLKTKELTYNDLEDVDKSRNLGVGGTYSSNDVQNKDGSASQATTASGSLDYGMHDKRQTTRATIGSGKIIVDNEEVSPSGLNRDIENSQVITKDIEVENIHVDGSYKNDTAKKEEEKAKEKWTDIGQAYANGVAGLTSDLAKVGVISEESKEKIDEVSKRELTKLDDGVNAVSVATVDSIKNSLSEDKDKQEDKSNKDEFTIVSVYNENRQARGDVGKVREDDSKTNKLNNAGDLDAKENDKLVKEVSKELSGAKAALYNDEDTDAKKQNYKGMYDGEENKVYVNTDKTDITDAGEYVNLVYHENRHAQKTQEGIENTADQEELVTHYGDRAEKLWEDANRREGKTTGGTTQKTISEWRQENNANYPSVFKNSEASKVENEQPFEFGKKDIDNTFGLLKWAPITTNTKTDDYLNVETKHEHGFYEDGSGDNIGFGKKGKMDEEMREGYTFDGKHYDDDIIRQAQKNLDERGELDKSKYSLVGNNCQDFADKLREEYKKIKQNQEE